MATIDEYKAKCNEHEKKTGKYLSCGKCVAIHREMHTKPIPAGTGENSKLILRNGNNSPVRRTGRRIKAEDRKRIENLFNKGHTAIEISDITGFARSTVRKLLINLGYDNVLEHESYKPWTEEDDRILTDGYLSGVSTKELMKLTGRSKASVATRISKLGLVKKKSPL